MIIVDLESSINEGHGADEPETVIYHVPNTGTVMILYERIDGLHACTNRDLVLVFQSLALITANKSYEQEHPPFSREVKFAILWYNRREKEGVGRGVVSLDHLDGGRILNGPFDTLDALS